MKTPGSVELFGILVQAGSILTGFCATFLAFRLQREATYYRDKKQQHFTSAFLLILIATLCSAAFGFVLPLLGLIHPLVISPTLVIAGMTATLVLLGTYIADELIHYEILVKRDWSRWQQKMYAVGFGVSLGVIVFFLIWLRA